MSGFRSRGMPRPSAQTSNSSNSISSEVQSAHRTAMEMLADWFNNRLKEEIKSDKWKWPVEPKLRDIINSGRLIDTQMLVRRSDGSFEVLWPAPYTTEVINGGVSPESGRFPGRDFTAEPMRELPMMYAHFLKIALKQPASGRSGGFSSRSAPRT